MTRRFALIAAAACAVVALAVPASAQDKAKVEQGSALFTSQKCIMCHSIGAKGNKKGPLDDVGAKLKAEDIRHWIASPDEMRVKSNATRTPAMKQMNLSKDQIDALVAFLQQQRVAVADDNATR